MSLRHVMDVYRGYQAPRFRIMESKGRWFSLSGLLVVLSLFGLLGFVGVGLTFSIDFEGGAQVLYPLKASVEVADIQQVLADRGLDGEVQIITGEQGDEVAIRTESLTDMKDSAAFLGELASQAGIDTTEVSVEDIGPTWGAQISRKAGIGLVVVIIAISIYIAVRFAPAMAAGAMVALVHDVIITAGVYALTGREVTPETVIAILTILGFSLYDTVVIYDKIQENTQSPATVARMGYDAVVNMSLNQVLMRSVNTSLVVLLPIASLLLFGGDTLKDFAFAMFVGTGIGAYSSIFVAAPVLSVLDARRRRRAGGAAAGRRPGSRPPAPKPTEAAAAQDAAATSATARQGGGRRPAPKSKRRPPAKRKRR